MTEKWKQTISILSFRDKFDSSLYETLSKANYQTEFNEILEKCLLWYRKVWYLKLALSV